jgi:hypothetical protein
MFLFAGAEVPVSGKIADRFTDGGENLPKERLALSPKRWSSLPAEGLITAVLRNRPPAIPAQFLGTI